MSPKLLRIHLAFVILFIVTATLGAHFVWQYSYQTLLDTHQSQIQQYSSYITTKLDKFAHIPQLLSKDQKLIDALLLAPNTAQIDLTNQYLEKVNHVIQASDTYLLDRQANTIASSNWQLKRSFVGRNFKWRPYFQNAIQGDQSHYYALGSTSGQRGYYYSYPVTYAGSIIGVVVVKMDLSSIEEHWENKNSYFVATDPNYIIFMSSQSEWLFKSVSPLEPKIQAQVRQSQQYLDKPISSLGLIGDFNASVAEWHNPAQPWINGDFIVTSHDLKNIPLTIRVLTPKITIFWDTFGFLVITTMVFAIIYLSMLLALHRQTRKKQIETLQYEAKQKLEFLVMERTAKLNCEIEERTKAEQRLRQTQNELIQAAKLAVLGQMSASISHELNNPLAAIRSFADNGRRYLANGKADRTDENLVRISALTERMAKISTQLRSFARKSDGDEWVVAQLYPIVLSTKELIQSQLNAQRIQFELHQPDHPIWLKINPIQLEQVLLNLLTNAIQALISQDQKKIVLTMTEHHQQMHLHIDDNGQGLPQQAITQLFDPFFTTKKNGLGLGLSISQQIIQSMNGQITAKHSSLGGARFTITLPAIDAPTSESIL